MARLLFVLATLIGTSVPASTQDDAKAIIDVIESLQEPIKDFRCEYEGTYYYMTEEARKNFHLKDDGLYSTFSGMFVWQAGGNAFNDSILRIEPDGVSTRETIIVHGKEKRAERFTRAVDAPGPGSATIDNYNSININRTSCLGGIFLIDEIKRLAADPSIDLAVSDAKIGGDALKLLDFSYKGIKHKYISFWVDLKRGGHAVRRESYGEGNAVIGRVNITLTPFKIGGTEVWMPTYGTGEGHMQMRDGKVVIPKELTTKEIIYINNGTLEFNVSPAPSTFTKNYKPGTPISDNLRRVRYEFAQQKAAKAPTKREAEASLREQLTKAEEQRTELVANSPTGWGSGWSSALVWIFGATTLVASVTMVILRGRR